MMPTMPRTTTVTLGTPADFRVRATYLDDLGGGDDHGCSGEGTPMPDERPHADRQVDDDPAREHREDDARTRRSR